MSIELMSIERGQRITLVFEGKEFDVIVIDPNGLGEQQPTVGFDFRMMEKYVGVSESTLRSWVREINGESNIELPSGKTLRVREILGSDNNQYNVIEATDWFELVVDLLVNPGKTGKGLKEKLGAFLRLFAVKGFYAEAYTVDPLSSEIVQTLNTNYEMSEVSTKELMKLAMVGGSFDFLNDEPDIYSLEDGEPV